MLHGFLCYLYIMLQVANKVPNASSPAGMLHPRISGRAILATLYREFFLLLLRTNRFLLAALYTKIAVCLTPAVLKSCGVSLFALKYRSVSILHFLMAASVYDCAERRCILYKLSLSVQSTLFPSLTSRAGITPVFDKFPPRPENVVTSQPS